MIVEESNEYNNTLNSNYKENYYDYNNPENRPLAVHENFQNNYDSNNNPLYNNYPPAKDYNGYSSSNLSTNNEGKVIPLVQFDTQLERKDIYSNKSGEGLNDYIYKKPSNPNFGK